MDAFRSLGGPAEAKITRGGSRFLAKLRVASAHDGMEAILAELRRAHHDAHHICFAYRLFRGAAPLEGSSDDGEPPGSAGEPILRRLVHENLHDVIGVVIRYFGGTKLGIGGLQRAYSDAIDKALEGAQLVYRQLTVELGVEFPPDVTSGIMATLHRAGAVIREIEYDTAGMARVALPPSRVNGFIDAIREATGAQATVRLVGEPRVEGTS